MTPASSVANGTWHHIVAVKAGSTTSSMAIYLDGVLQTPASTVDDGPGQTTVDLAFPLFIGMANSRGTPLWGVNGTMDDVRIYSRSLSHSEIQSLYAGNAATGSGKYTLGSNVTVNGNLNIYSGTLDASASNYAISASGSFTNNAGFTPRAGTVTLNGIGTHLKMYGSSLYNLVVSSAKSTILRTAAAVTNALTINSSASLTLNGNTLTATNATISNSATLTEGTGSVIHTASLSISPATLAIGGNVVITLNDSDENIDGTVQDTVTVIFDGSSLTLTETSVDSGIFQRSIATAHGAPTGDNTTIESNDRCSFFVTASFSDEQDGTDSRSARAEITDSGVSCETGGGGGGNRSGGNGGGSRSIGPRQQEEALRGSKDILRPQTQIRTRAEQLLVALSRRRDILLQKSLTTKNLREKNRYEAGATFIFNILTRLTSCG